MPGDVVSPVISNIKKILEKLGFDADNNLLVALNVDNVGLATEATLSAIKNALASVGSDKLLTKPDNPPNLDVALSTRASESTLSDIKSQTDKLTFDTSNNLLIGINADNVGILKKSDLSFDSNGYLNINARSVSNPPNLDISLSSLDSDIKSRLPRELLLDDGSGTYDKVYRSGNAILTSIGEDKVGLAKDSTVSGLKGSDGRTLTDIYNKAYDSSNDRIKISLDNDSVGLAKDSTLSKLTNALSSVGTDKLLTTPDNPPNLDIKLSQLDSDVKSRLVREIELNDGSGTYAPIYRSGNAMLISINEDKVGLAKDSTVSGLKGSDGRTLTDIYNAVAGDQPRHITNAYDSTNDRFKISIDNDSVGIAKDSTVSKLTNALKSVGSDKLLTTPDNPPNLDLALSQLDSDLKSLLARKLSLNDGSGNYGEIYRSGNAMLISINEDKTGILKKSDLSFDSSGYLNVNAQSVANPPNLDVPLSDIKKNTDQPTSINSQDVTIDNSGGSSDVSQALFSSATANKQASLYRDPNDSGTVYLGGSGGQYFPFNPGDVFQTKIDDLSKIYVRVPAGVKATIHVIWEA